MAVVVRNPPTHEAPYQMLLAADARQVSVSDDEVRESADTNQLRLLRERGSELPSPKTPAMMRDQPNPRGVSCS